MTWEYTLDGNEVVIKWNDEEMGRVQTEDGEINVVRNGFPTDPDIRPVIQESIQSAGTPVRIDMITDLIIFEIDRY